MDKRILICFACREEISLNGLMETVRKINPDLCIDVDSAYAMPLSLSQRKNWIIPIIGNGPAIQLQGTNFIIPAKNRRLIEEIADKNKIKTQYELPDGNNGGTNATTLVNAGYNALQINIPVSNQHSGESKASLQDVKETIILLEKL